MLTVLFVFLICIVVYFILDCFIFDCFDFFDTVEVLSLFIVGGLLFGTMLSGLLGCFLPFEIKTETQYIYSLQDTSSITGDCFLCVGDVDETLCYRYFVKDENDCLIYESIPAEDVVIKFDDIPRIEKYTKVYEHFLWIIPFDSTPVPTTLFIPENSVIKDITVDFQ